MISQNQVPFILINERDHFFFEFDLSINIFGEKVIDVIPALN